MKSAIITGATGAIGIALINELISKNIRVLVITRDNSPRNAHLPKSDLVQLRYSSLQELHAIQPYDGEKFDTFYHLAWDGTVGTDRNNLKKQCDNVKYAIDAVQLAARYGCRMFVGVGSQAEYGRFNGPLTPNTKTDPETGYGIAKLCAGHMTREQAAMLGLHHVWVRVLSVYGPYDGQQSLIMSTISKLQAGEPIKCTLGEQIWDYLYSGDAAEALYLLGSSDLNDKTYVLGSGIGRPLRTYIEEMRNIVNPEAIIEWGAIPYSEKQVMHLEANIDELKSDISWTPKIEFKDGIRYLLSYL